jgi:hypothetical protein
MELNNFDHTRFAPDISPTVGFTPTMHSHGLSDGMYDRLRRDVHFSHPRLSRTRQAEIVAQIVSDEILEGSPDVYFTLLCYSAWKGKPITSTVRVTPDFARFLLKIHVNWHNRGVSPHGLQMYRQDMRDGHWLHNDETIIIADTGHLNNGQHRLEGCKREGTEFTTELCVGVPRETRHSLDTGIKRTTGVSLGRIENPDGSVKYKNAHNLSPTATLVIAYVRHKEIGGHPATKQEILDYVEAHPGLSDPKHRRVAQACRRPIKLVRYPIFWAMSYLFDQVDPVDATQFFSRLSQGINLAADDPILLLRKTFTEVWPGQRKQYPNKDRIATAYIIKAWNAYGTRSPMKQLKFSDAESFPIIR